MALSWRDFGIFFGDLLLWWQENNPSDCRSIGIALLCGRSCVINKSTNWT